MAEPFLATITLLSGAGGAQPKGGTTHLAMITPLSGARPGHDLPSGGYPSHGLPETPVDPGWGGGWGSGATDPGWGGGVPVPPSVWPPMPPPPLPPDLESQVIVAVHRPGVTEWTVKAYPVPQPKG